MTSFRSLLFHILLSFFGVFFFFFRGLFFPIMVAFYRNYAWQLHSPVDTRATSGVKNVPLQKNVTSMETILQHPIFQGGDVAWRKIRNFYPIQWARARGCNHILRLANLRAICLFPYTSFKSSLIPSWPSPIPSWSRGLGLNIGLATGSWHTQPFWLTFGCWEILSWTLALDFP